MRIAKVSNGKMNVNVKMRKALKFGGFFKLDTTSAGGVSADQFNSTSRIGVHVGVYHVFSGYCQRWREA